VKLIKAKMPEIKVVMLTTSDEDDDLFEAIKYALPVICSKTSMRMN
jgi:DNA-binding NarL/FixJ family response regulator